jgi:hypothetical protein
MYFPFLASGCGCSLYVWYGICSRNFNLKESVTGECKAPHNKEINMKVSFKLKEDALTHEVENVTVLENITVLHYTVDEFKHILLKMAITNQLEYYKYPDGHVGITIPTDSIYWITH